MHQRTLIPPTHSGQVENIVLHPSGPMNGTQIYLEEAHIFCITSVFSMTVVGQTMKVTQEIPVSARPFKQRGCCQLIAV